jgi:hypothetical protein
VPATGGEYGCLVLPNKRLKLSVRAPYIGAKPLRRARGPQLKRNRFDA